MTALVVQRAISTYASLADEEAGMRWLLIELLPRNVSVNMVSLFRFNLRDRCRKAFTKKGEKVTPYFQRYIASVSVHNLAARILCRFIPCCVSVRNHMHMMGLVSYSW